MRMHYFVMFHTSGSSRQKGHLPSCCASATHRMLPQHHNSTKQPAGGGSRQTPQTSSSSAPMLMFGGINTWHVSSFCSFSALPAESLSKAAPKRPSLAPERPVAASVSMEVGRWGWCGRRYLK
ncbi:hypothetical protein, conserved [Leishmania tarentolae]|uniref:Uncharacterized protein n=1 Tax=Leishmania tarentolae TaxID=5689 RepID=A0A640KA25_LEITA|nr:hypothetical protein, conserved [Leishmania tarentolae]